MQHVVKLCVRCLAIWHRLLPSTSVRPSVRPGTVLSLSPICFNLSAAAHGAIRADARMANEPCAFTMGPNRLASRILTQIQGIVLVVLYQTNSISCQLSQNITTYFPVISLYRTCQDIWCHLSERKYISTCSFHVVYKKLFWTNQKYKTIL